MFDRLFNSDGDPTLQRDGIARIYVWLDRGNCPHPVETTANLVALVLRDAAPSTSSTAFEGDLRLSYAMAIVRCVPTLLRELPMPHSHALTPCPSPPRSFVNSLVDPLQTAYFARSIASLAAQIGLPLWFVELRHQATHEDLPRLAVLRDAARQVRPSFAWPSQVARAVLAPSAALDSTGLTPRRTPFSGPRLALRQLLAPRPQRLLVPPLPLLEPARVPPASPTLDPPPPPPHNLQVPPQVLDARRVPRGSPEGRRAEVLQGR